MRVIDVGCGCGRSLTTQGVSDADEIIGIDIKCDVLKAAQQDWPERHFFQASGEHLPFSNYCFDRVLAKLSLPYMSIPLALREAHRVLRPGGTLWASFHGWQFTLSELRSAFPRPLPFLFRLLVLMNGCVLYMLGTSFAFESFQSERALRIAFRRAGFTGLKFSRPIPGRITVEATSSEFAEESQELRRVARAA